MTEIPVLILSNREALHFPLLFSFAPPSQLKGAQLTTHVKKALFLGASESIILVDLVCTPSALIYRSV